MTLYRSIKVIWWCAFVSVLLYLAYARATSRNLSLVAMWLVVAILVSRWAMTWRDGVFPGSLLERRERPAEFVVIQVLFGLALLGLCYLIAVTFHR